MTPGMKTSEFLVLALTVVAAILVDAANWIPPRYAWLGGILVAVGYMISRGLAKTEPRP
jgi:hypothetical protein